MYKFSLHLLLTLSRLIVVIFAFSLCSGCLYNFNEQENTSFLESPYQRELATEYIKFAKSEAMQYDWRSSIYFKKKALKILSGKEVYPEEVYNNKWRLSDNDKEVLEQARDHLMILLNNKEVDPRLVYPKNTAKVQLLFDCWVEQQSENWQIVDIMSCRENFYNLLDKIYLDVFDNKIHKQKNEDSSSNSISKANLNEQKNYKINISLEKRYLTKENLSIIKQVAEDFSKSSFNKKVYILAYYINKENNNKKDFKNKIIYVENEMVNLGIKKSLISKLFFTNIEGYKYNKDNINEFKNFLEIVIE